MVRALGSLMTPSHDNALGVGLVMHFASGVVFVAWCPREGRCARLDGAEREPSG